MHTRPRNPCPRARGTVLILAAALALVLGAVGTVPMALAAEETVTRGVVADATIQEASPGTNFGSRTTLLADNSPAIRFLVRLDVSVPEGKVPKRVTLSLYCVDASPDAGTVRLVTGSWSEGSVTWDNAPAFGSQVLATLGDVAEGSRHQVDLTAAAAGRTTLDVMVVGGSNNGADFSSREASSARRPTLVVVYGDAGGQDPSRTRSPVTSSTSA